MYQERTYREWVNTEGLVRRTVAVGESDLMVIASEDVSERVRELARDVRALLEEYIGRDPDFRRALSPYEPAADSPEIVRSMSESAARYGVGPMAAVAGAVSEYVGRGLGDRLEEVIIENGGDIFVRSIKPVTMSLYAGEEYRFTGKVRFLVRPNGSSLGVCTSSGTVGHSTSFGCADAVTVVCDSAIEADAAATALANSVHTEACVDRIVERAQNSERIIGAVVAIGDRLGVWGEVELV